MLKAIFFKEWLKLRLYIFTLFSIIILSLGYFLYDLNFAFSTIEPESMMWYRLAILENKPYDNFIYLFILISLVISFAGFLPEMVKNRIKILVHLPKKPHEVLSLHLVIGTFFVLTLCVFLAISLLVIMNIYYPSMISGALFKEFALYIFSSLVSYLIVSAMIIEKNKLFRFLKFLLLGLFFIAFFKDQYYYYDLIWLGVFAFLPFLVLDGLYSIKEQRIESLGFRVSLGLVIVFLLFNTYMNYKQNYKKEFDRYYIFYSNIIKDFVYQKNYGDHHFEYGIKGKKVFDQKEYESYLPFVYWRNLDIQKRLPVVIDDIEYSKKQIKSSRLSFSYQKEYLKEKSIKLYPLFNPLSHKGMISFPEEMISIAKDKLNIYSYDKGIDTALTDELNKLLKEQNIKHPIKNIWGKTTNMKPFDKGYLIEDSKHKLFNIKRYDDRFELKAIAYPKDLNLEYIKISENRQKILSGYAIGEDSSFYLLTWDFGFKKVDLPMFDHRSMKLKLISNPMNYLIRYDDGKDYYAVVFDKDLNEIKSINLKR